MYLSSWRVADRFLGQNGECDLNADCSRVENHGKRTFSTRHRLHFQLLFAALVIASAVCRGGPSAVSLLVDINTKHFYIAQRRDAGRLLSRDFVPRLAGRLARSRVISAFAPELSADG